MLLDGTGDDFPTPPSAEPFEPELEADPDAWLNNIEHSHLDDQEREQLKAVLIDYSKAFSRSKTNIGCCGYFKAELPLKPGTGYLYIIFLYLILLNTTIPMSKSCHHLLWSKIGTYIYCHTHYELDRWI